VARKRIAEAQGTWGENVSVTEEKQLRRVDEEG